MCCSRQKESSTQWFADFRGLEMLTKILKVNRKNMDPI